jgi:hypothetical protein
MDPVKNGSEIFLQVFEQLELKQSTSLDFIDELLSKLITGTNGLFIVDFIDPRLA